MFDIRIIVGIIAIIVWGIFSYVTFPARDFLNIFVGGMANFLFFVAGIVAESRKPLSENERIRTSAMIFGEDNYRITPIIIRISISVLLFSVISQVLQSGPISTVDQIIQRGDAKFTEIGYRDIQTYLTGFVALPMLLSLVIYVFHVGSRYRRVTFKAVWVGCAISLGSIMTLALIFGAVRPGAVISYLHMQAPSALAPFSGIILTGAAWAITLSVDVITITMLTLLLWTAARAGARWGRPV